MTPVQMERIFADYADPVTGRALGQSPHVYAAGTDRRRPAAGFDCTFTAPKSVCVLWALADTQTREAIYGCHRQAIADVPALIERDVARTRMGTNGVAQVEVTGVIAAAFDHWDSRENDPNLHTHVVIANRVQGPDGRQRPVRVALLDEMCAAAGLASHGVADDEDTLLGGQHVTDVVIGETLQVGRLDERWATDELFDREFLNAGEPPATSTG